MSVILRFLKSIFSFIKTFCFWCIYYLCIVIFVFGVSLGDLASSMAENIACFMLMTAPVVFLLVVPLSHIGNRFEIGNLPIYLEPMLWVPYKGLDLLGFIKAMRDPTNTGSEKMRDVGVYIRRLFHTILWWLLTGFMVSSVMAGQNPIYNAIALLPGSELLIKLGIILGTYLILVIIVKVLWKIKLDSFKSESRDTGSGGTKRQKYFERHPEKMPTACSACGGPYPECKASCNLYDD